MPLITLFFICPSIHRETEPFVRTHVSILKNHIFLSLQWNCNYHSKKKSKQKNKTKNETKHWKAQPKMQEVRRRDNYEMALETFRAQTDRPIRKPKGEWNHEKQHNNTTTTTEGYKASRPPENWKWRWVTSQYNTGGNKMTLGNSCLQFCGRIVKCARNKKNVREIK